MMLGQTALLMGFSKGSIFAPAATLSAMVGQIEQKLDLLLGIWSYFLSRSGLEMMVSLCLDRRGQQFHCYCHWRGSPTKYIGKHTSLATDKV